MYINVRSIRNKLDDIDIVLSQKQSDVLILVVTWLYNNKVPTIKFANYNGLHVCREDKGGCVSIFIKEKYGHEVLCEINNEGNNILGIHIIPININIYGVYKQLSSSYNLFLNTLEGVMSCRNSIFIGDFNICILENKNSSQDYIEILQTNGYNIWNVISNDNPTRVDQRSGRKSIIDHISHIDCAYSMIMSEHFISDHRIIDLYLEIKEQLKVGKQTYMYI